MRLSKFELVIAFYLLTFQFHGQASPPAEGWTPIEVQQGKLLVKTSVAGIDGYSMIDSGATGSAINERFLAKHSLKLKSSGLTRVSGIVERKRRRLYRNVPVKILGVDTEFSKLVDISFQRQDIQFVLGADFLGLGVFQFDYPRQRMRLLDRKSVNLRQLSNVKSRFDDACNDIIAKVRLNNEQNVWLKVDTGAHSGVLLDRSVATRNNWLASNPSQTVHVSGVNATGIMEQFRLPLVQIGDFEVLDVLTTVPAKGQKTELFRREKPTGSNLSRTRSKAKGLLGYDVLKHFILTIDYRSGKIHLQPGQRSSVSALKST
jgi:predicted aspartyl protease